MGLLGFPELGHLVAAVDGAGRVRDEAVHRLQDVAERAGEALVADGPMIGAWSRIRVRV
jgi:hypothetical protein